MGPMKNVFTKIRQIRALPGEVRALRKEVKRMKKTLREDHAYMNAVRKRDERQYYTALPPEKIHQELKDWYRRETGRKLDLEHPEGFSEKVQWLKLYDSTPLKTKLADKYLVREYVREKIGGQYLTKLYGVWNDFDEIDFDELPDRFYLKANHGCGFNLGVENKAEFDISAARKKFKRWMDTNYAYSNGFELQYRDIPRVIYAEEYLGRSQFDLRDEVKVFCFDGKAELFQFFQKREEKTFKIAIYDREWRKTPYTFGHPMLKRDLPRPEKLDEIIWIAETLSSGFALARVDLYTLKTGEIRFGEITFTPYSGSKKWMHEEHNLELGEKIRLPMKYYMPGVSYEFEKKTGNTAGDTETRQ